MTANEKLTTNEQLAVEQAAIDLYRQDPDWVTFYRQILGLRGIVRRHYPTREDLAEFEQTEVYREILRMVADLRKRNPMPEATAEPIRVVTIRLPKSLHDAIRLEAHEHRTSMNRLCISKLLQLVDAEMVPSDIDSGAAVLAPLGLHAKAK